MPRGRRARPAGDRRLLLVVTVVVIVVLALLSRLPRSRLPAPHPGTAQVHHSRSALPVTHSHPARDSQEVARPPQAAPPPPRPAGPVVAIVIDDVGYREADLEPFLALGCPLTFAVLPALPLSAALADRCREAGNTVILHLPMEPLGEQQPGPGAVTTAMEDEAIARVVAADLASVPGAVGISNHMGSRATADARVMAAVMAVAAKRGLFFVDSLTGPGSTVREQAAQQAVPALARDVFLDPAGAEAEVVAEQVDKLARVARRRGWALGIGHVHPETARGLAAALPKLEQQGITIVPMQELLGGRAD